MVAFVVEKLTGQRFEDYVQKEFFDPIGMPGATFFEPKSDFAGTYIDGKAQAYWHVIERPAGSVNATAQDMGNYVRFFLQRGSVNGKPLVSASSMERMETPATSLTAREAGLKAGYSLNNYTHVVEGFEFHGHNGGVNGGLAELAYAPELGIGYAFMINTGEGAALNEISRLIVRFMTRDLAKPAVPAASTASQQLSGTYLLQPASPRTQLLYPLERILGLMRAQASGSELTLSAVFSRGPGTKFIHVGGNRYREEKSPVAEMALVHDEGEIALQGGFQGSFHVIPAWKGWLQAICAGGFSLSVVLTLLLAPIWVYRWVKGSIRTWAMPGRLLAAASVLVLVVSSFVAQGPGNDFEMLGVLGKASAWSVGFLLLTLLFTLLTVIAFVARQAGGFVSRWASRFLLIGMLYFGWWGWIGIRTWNY